MRTYTAELARWRSEPLHEGYYAIALAHAKSFERPGPRRHAYETTCPYCGHEGLTGTVRIGSKGPSVEVELTREGFEAPAEDGGQPELMKADCQNPECGAAVDPISYFAPATFYAHKTNEDLFPPL
jgi:hypothetical protein